MCAVESLLNRSRHLRCPASPILPLMPDVMTPAQRSRCMSRIRGRNTKPELALRSALWRCGLRFRVTTRLPGRPDVVFPTERVAVFVDGCFWHSCPEHRVQPATNAAFWQEKLSANVARDRRADQALAADGWTVLRFWEHDVEEKINAVVNRVRRSLARKRFTRAAAARPASMSPRRAAHSQAR
jgi:DNA mismatch endonuclease (patch repair protein)